MSVAVRVIACLDVDRGRVVKGVNFEGLRDAGDPVELAARYDAQGVDELTFLDITASSSGRETTFEVVRRTAEQVFIPLTVGGGVRAVEDVDALLRAGADKIGVNTAAIGRPDLLNEIAERFGRQVLVLSVDARRVREGDKPTPSGFQVTTHGGRTGTGIDAIAWAREAADRGAGEILLNSMDADGTKAGYDLPLLRLVREAVSVPVIASGGAGKLDDFLPAVEAGADAVLAASVFHFGDLTVGGVKSALRAASPSADASPGHYLGVSQDFPINCGQNLSMTTATGTNRTKRRVLVVDDEDNVTHLVSSALRFDGFETVTADSGTAALAKVAETDPDLIVLDVMMPGLDGLGVLQNLRSAGSQVPVIFLTARDAANDRIGGLRAGADDYVVKPFSIEELLARVHAVLRRSSPDDAREGILRIADLELDENSHEVTRGNTEIHLTATEFELLRYLMRNERVVLSKSQILDRVWKYDFNGQSNIVELYIGYLRKKIDVVEPKLIHTVRGAGYVVKAPRV